MAQSSEMIDRLSRASTGAKIAIFVVVAALLGGLYYYFFYSDLSTEHDSEVNTKSRLTQDEKRLLKRKSDFQSLLQQKKDVETRLKTIIAALPEIAEPNSFMQHLEIQASTANVRLATIVLEKPVPVETFMRQPVKVEVDGDFHQIIQYFKLLADTPRIITVNDLVIGQAKREGDRINLTARFTASTFHQAPAGAKGTPAKPGAPAAPTPTTPAPGTPEKPVVTPAAMPGEVPPVSRPGGGMTEPGKAAPMTAPAPGLQGGH